MHLTFSNDIEFIEEGHSCFLTTVTKTILFLKTSEVNCDDDDDDDDDDDGDDDDGGGGYGDDGDDDGGGYDDDDDGYDNGGGDDCDDDNMQNKYITIFASIISTEMR